MPQTLTSEIALLSDLQEHWKVVPVAGGHTITDISPVVVLPVDATGGASNVALPAASGSNTPNRVIVVKKVDASANNVNVIPNGSETLDGAASVSLTTQYQTIVIVSDGSNWHQIA